MLEDGGVKLHCLFGIVVEPQERRDLLLAGHRRAFLLCFARLAAWYPTLWPKPQDGLRFSISARSFSCRSLSSGVKASPKSSAVNTWRISISDSPGCGLGQRLTQSMAAASEATSHSQKPAISSLVSVNGPSVTRRLLPEKVTRAPFELGCRPSPASMTPAFTSSSLNLPMAAKSSWLGSSPASDAFVALTKTMTFIVCSFQFR